MTIPVVTFTGQSLRTLDDAALLQLIMRTDLPGYLTDLYADEADRRMGNILPASMCDEVLT